MIYGTIGIHPHETKNKITSDIIVKNLIKYKNYWYW